MRMLVQSLESVKLDHKLILNHGNSKIIYGIPIAMNFHNYLLSIDKEPAYLFDLKEEELMTQKIIDFWKTRWYLKRIQKNEILKRISHETTTYPIQHAGRPLIKKIENSHQLELFS